MLSIQLSWPVAVALIACVAALAFIIIRRDWVKERTQRAFTHAKPIATALCPIAGFMLMELPYNDRLLHMDMGNIVIGVILCSALFAFVYLAGQRSRASMLAFLVACLIVGVANHYVAAFKGQPILPSDVAALQTAAAVGGGYTYAIDDTVVIPLLIVLLFACALLLMPASRPSRRTAAVNAAVAVAIAACSCAWFLATDIERDLDCTVDVWSSLDSYKDQGSLLCFLQRAQKIQPTAPEGFSHESAVELRSSASPLGSVAYAAETGQLDRLPSVVVVMNETFSDISRYDAVDDSYATPTHYQELARESLAAGDVYVSALGGGTCNSEFEFLTGSSSGFLGAGVYPYMLYDLDDVDNLASYLGSIGYSTCAIHPAEASNWRRDRVYSQLGFEEFLDIEHFDGAETRRGMVTDAATYDVILERLKNSEGPQFIFDVTLASHGGYDTGLIPEDELTEVLVQGEPDAEASEYASCIAASDEEFAAFIDALRELDRPVVVCMFGDHQPGFADRLAEASFGEQVGLMGIDHIQERYVTPYLIWTNSSELCEAHGVGNTHDLSLNYLAATMLNAAGIPLDEQFSYLLAAQQQIPAINLNGYQDASGTWHWHGEESDASEAYKALAIIQHDNLFDHED